MKFGYVILYVQDVEKTVDFYESAFTMTRRFMHESGAYAELETGETVLAFASEDLASSHGFQISKTRPDGTAPSFEVAFVTDDVATAHHLALDAGAEEAAPPEVKPWGQTVSYVRDCNGFLIEICSPIASG